MAKGQGLGCARLPQRMRCSLIRREGLRELFQHFGSPPHRLAGMFSRECVLLFVRCAVPRPLALGVQGADSPLPKYHSAAGKGFI